MRLNHCLRWTAVRGRVIVDGAVAERRYAYYPQCTPFSVSSRFCALCSHTPHWAIGRLLGRRLASRVRLRCPQARTSEANRAAWVWFRELLRLWDWAAKGRSSAPRGLDCRTPCAPPDDDGPQSASIDAWPGAYRLDSFPPSSRCEAEVLASFSSPPLTASTYPPSRLPPHDCVSRIQTNEFSWPQCPLSLSLLPSSRLRPRPRPRIIQNPVYPPYHGLLKLSPSQRR